MASTGLRQDSVHLKQRWPPERKSKCLFRRSYERIGDLEKSKLVEWLEETAEIQAIQFINGTNIRFQEYPDTYGRGLIPQIMLLTGNKLRNVKRSQETVKLKMGAKQRIGKARLCTLCVQKYTLYF